MRLQPAARYKLGVVLYTTGLARHNEGRLLIAADLFDLVSRQAKEEREQIPALWLAGRTLWHVGRRPEAEPYLRRAHELSLDNPGYAPVWLPEEDMEDILAHFGWQ
jgi:hypothetical protein